MDLIEAIDGFKSVYDLSEDFPNLTLNEIKQIISIYLLKGSYLEKVELYPQIINIDEEVLEKMSTETLALAYSLENICDGELSLAEISKKIGSPIREIKKVLDTLEKQVIFKKRYLK
jgi:aminopeptidase-like protein